MNAQKNLGGRPTMSLEERMITISVQMKPADIVFLDSVAAQVSLTRAELIRNLVDTSLSEVKVLRKLGIVSAVGAVRHMFSKAHTQSALPIT